MTNHDYTVPLDEMPTKAGIQNYAWREFMEDHYDTIIHALSIAQRVKQGPSEGMIKAWNSKEKYYETFFGAENYNAMIEQLLKEVGDADQTGK